MGFFEELVFCGIDEYFFYVICVVLFLLGVLLVGILDFYDISKINFL